MEWRLESATEYHRRAADVRALAKLYTDEVNVTLNAIGDSYALLALYAKRTTEHGNDELPTARRFPLK